MFAGTLVDSLQSTECAHARSRVDPFLDVKLNSIGCGTVEAALRQFTTPEELVCSLCCAECAHRDCLCAWLCVWLHIDWRQCLGV